MEPTAAQSAGTAHFDEWHGSAGCLDRYYGEFFSQFNGARLAEVATHVERSLESAGCNFNSADGWAPFQVDPIPRLLSSQEWATISAGVEQRAQALERFVADVYGDGVILDEQIVPRDLVMESHSYEPLARDFAEHVRVWSGVAGLDLVRPADGSFQVLEDNTRTPSGLAYALAARGALEPELADLGWGRADSSIAIELLAKTLRSASLVDEPEVVLLTDGRASSAWFEHRTLAAQLGIPLLTLEEIERTRDDELVWRDAGKPRRIDVIYRRTGCDRLRNDDDSLTSVGEALLRPLSRGKVVCINAFGSGIADDKAIHSFVEDMIGFYLSDEPVLESVPTFLMSVESDREWVLEHLEHMVIKPRSGLGGSGVVVCRDASSRDLERVRASISKQPSEFVAQRLIDFSVHPTLVGEHVEPRHVDLRPFALTVPGQSFAPPAPLTRVAFEAGAIVVNTSQNGGGKDTWILS